MRITFKELKELLVQEQLKEAQRLINEHDYRTLEREIILPYTVFIQANRQDPSDPFSIVFRQIAELLFSTRSKDVQQFINQQKYQEAYDILDKIKEWFTKLNISQSDSLADNLKNFEKNVIDASLKDARDNANKNTEDGYKKAYEILNKLRPLKISAAAKLEIIIKQQEAAWRKAQEPVAPVEQKWIFVKQISSAESVEKTDWKITDQKLFLNLDATEAMTQDSFVDLIKEAKDKNLPFILLMVRSGDSKKFFPYFFGANAIKSFLQTWKSKNKLINPMNREEIFNIEIYVMGDDGILRLLKDNVDATYLERQLVDYKGPTDDPLTDRRTHNYEFKPELEKPGVAQVFIADLYKEQEAAAKPELQQLERLWLSWALPKFAPEDATQKEQAIQRLNALPNRPELVPGKVEIEPPVQPVQPSSTQPVSPKALLSTLQNLTNKLGQVTQKLKIS